MGSPWFIWSFVPGLHWMAWMQAGSMARYPWYYGIGAVYALPCVLWLVSRRLPLSLVLLSWLLGLLHAQIQKQEINQRIASAVAAASNHEALRQALLQAALKHRGRLSVTQGVMETGRPFPEVERVLSGMVASGYVFTRNNPETGVIEYVFKELL